MRIGFIGLGAMGAPLAESLLADGHALTVFNRTRARAEPFAAKGARVADTPAQCAKGNELVFTLVSDDHALEQVVFGEQGLLRGLEKGALHVSSSTISVALAERLDEEHRRAGQGFVSATIFGRPAAVAERKAWFAVAGRDVDRVRPVLEKLGRGVTIVGEKPADANTIKLAGNFMLAAMIELLGEGFAFVEKSGVSRERFLELLQAVFGPGPFTGYAGLIAKRSFEPVFPVKLGLKDVRLLLEAAEKRAVPLPLGSIARDGLLAAIANGLGELDWTAYAQLSELRAGLKR